MKKVLIIAAVGEAAIGLALMIVPSLVGQLLLGAELNGVAIPVARVTGIALIALGITCWPGPPRAGMSRSAARHSPIDRHDHQSRAMSDRDAPSEDRLISKSVRRIFVTSTRASGR